jgi:heme/copper-type cytochrome/quinol oxidase subunit 1
METRVIARITLCAAVVAIIAGAIVVATDAAQEPSFGWFAYAPLPSESIRVVSAAAIGGAALLTLGHAGLAFWAGLTLGARRARPSP